jgi:hypothetical protein
MNAVLVVCLLVLLTALPIVGALFYFRKRGLLPGVGLAALCVGAGLVSVGLAFGFLMVLPRAHGYGRTALLYEVFVREALAEELARFLVVLLFVKLVRVAGKPERAAAGGLLAGLVFALVETAFHGADNIVMALLRAFSASPLHGACGIRAGLAANALLEKRPATAFRFFVFAWAIHGVYNYIVNRPMWLFPVLAVLIAWSGLGASLRFLQKKGNDL